MENEKNRSIDFANWLFENNYVPNRSFFWFDHTLGDDDVLFYELRELFDIYAKEKRLPEW